VQEMQTLVVQHWPACGAAVTPQQDLLVLALETPLTPHRGQARELVRAALAEVLGAHLGCGAGGIRLVSVAGRALRLDLKGGNIGLSVSHEPGLSLAAIHFGGPVGVDLMQVPREAQWQDEVPLLARDYLGPDVVRDLAILPVDERMACFARNWTALEASLKLSGLGLEEWSAVRQRSRMASHCMPLQLPSGFVGSLALPAAQGDGAQFRQ
jgi:4'-phosphopantetheinyl transferase